MIGILNILISFLLIFNSGMPLNKIEILLKHKLKDAKRFEYKIVSPKNINLKKTAIDKTREVKIEKGYAYVPVIIDKSRNGIVTVKLKIFKQVAVAVNDINRRTNISKADIVLEEREVSALRGKPVNPEKIISKYRAKRKIKEGTIILQNMVEKIPDVKRGDRVKAVYSKGIVNISFDAVARTSGSIGKIVKVKRRDNKIFKAEIVNKNLVKIIE